MLAKKFDNLDFHFHLQSLLHNLVKSETYHKIEQNHVHWITHYKQPLSTKNLDFQIELQCHKKSVNLSQKFLPIVVKEHILKTPNHLAKNKHRF